MKTFRSSPRYAHAIGKRGTPLAGAGLGRDALEALLLGVVGLRDGASSACALPEVLLPSNL